MMRSSPCARWCAFQARAPGNNRRGRSRATGLRSAFGAGACRFSAAATDASAWWRCRPTADQNDRDNLFLETPASGAPQNGTPNAEGFGDLQQGNLEQANVEAVKEISDLIAAQRAYEMNAK